MVLLRNQRRGFRRRILGVDYCDSPLLGMHSHLLVWGVCLGQKERVLLRRMVPPQVGLYAGENSSTASLLTVYSGGTVGRFFDIRPGQNFTIVQSKQGIG